MKDANCDYPKPAMLPSSPHFSSGPCKKHPGWSLDQMSIDLPGRSHRGRKCKRRLAEAIERSHRLLGLPDDWVVGIVPGSGTGAIEFALLNLLGPKDVDVIVSDGFSAYWANDICQIMGQSTFVHKVPFDLSKIHPNRDTVLVYNGTGNGFCFNNLDWVSDDREGLVIADAASAAFAMPMDFENLDVVTWSWQKGLGSEAGHGMVAFSPRALARAVATRPVTLRPKVMDLRKTDGTVLMNLFAGHTISTPSILALEDLHSALDWAEGIGGRTALWRRVRSNQAVFDTRDAQTTWIDWLAPKDVRSPVSICLRLVLPHAWVDPEKVKSSMISLLEEEEAAFDIFTMHDAPAGFRIWAGPTVEAADLRCLTEWLEWAFDVAMHQLELERWVAIHAADRPVERAKIPT